MKFNEKIYEFIILGNQEDIKGNAIPKLRMTQNSKWTKQAKRYMAWKEYVCSCFWIKAKKDGLGEAGYKLVMNIKPFQKQRGFMSINITWNKENHGDPESIFGSIADALWENDKHLDGMFTAQHGNIPQVKIMLKVYNE